MPGGRASFDLTADAPGDWAFHCHLLYHMHAGMMNVVKVRPMDEGRSASGAAPPSAHSAGGGGGVH
jgi:hypothetical protein